MQLATCLQFEELEQKLQQSHSHLEVSLQIKTFASALKTLFCAPRSIMPLVLPSSGEGSDGEFLSTVIRRGECKSLAQEQLAKERVDQGKKPATMLEAWASAASVLR